MLPTIFEYSQVKKHFVSLILEGQIGAQSRDLRLSKQAALTTAPGPPPQIDEKVFLGASSCLETWCFHSEPFQFPAHSSLLCLFRSWKIISIVVYNKTRLQNLFRTV